MLFDADVLQDVTSTLFDLRHHRDTGSVTGEIQGRGDVIFFVYEGNELALRHFHRGGFVSKFVNDMYIWTGLDNTRPWIEWNILQELAKKNLPVPTPIAARVVRVGLFYTADLVTRKIQNVESLDNWLHKRTLPPNGWAAVGQCIRRFHNAGVWHSDLNSRNILISDTHEVYLIDFDKAKIRPVEQKWQLENISRLRRDLNNLISRDSEFYYSDDDFRHLENGYHR